MVGNVARDLTRRGHQVCFFHPASTVFLRGTKTKLGFAGFNLRLQMPVEERNLIITLAAFLILFPISLCQLVLLIRRHNIQVINIHYPIPRFVYFAICRRLLPVTLVTSVHGGDVFPGGRPPDRCSKAVRFLLAASDRIVAPSKRFQADFVAVFPEFRAKAMFIHNGVDLAELNDLALDSSGCTEGPYVLCVSAYKEQKAIDVLIHAFQHVRKTDPTVKLVLVGAGHLRRDLEALATTIGISERVEFLGQRTRAEVAELLRGCEVFVLPSRFETFGIIILEAMAYEKPVVATRAGGIPEIIESGRNGILVKPDDSEALAEAITAVLKNQELRSRIARQGQLDVRERFGTEHSGAAYEAVFAGQVNPRPAYVPGQAGAANR